MPELKRSFQSGKMNKDLDERLVPNGEYRDALNIEISTSEEDDMGSAQTIKGNAQLYNKQNPTPMPEHTRAPINNNWSETYRNKTIGSVVDDKTNWGYRLVSGAPPEEHTDTWRPFLDQVNYVSADYIIRNNSDEEQPVLIDIYSVAVGLLQGWTVPNSPTDTVTVPSDIGLRLGMELEVLVNTPGGVSNAWIPGAMLFQNKLPKIIDIIDQGGSWDIKLSGEVMLHNTYVNQLVFSAPRVLNFEHDNLITGLNIIDDFLLWTDDHSEPKKIHIEKSVLGSRHPFTPNGINPLDWNKHTNFVTTQPVANSTGSPIPWLGEEHAAGIPGDRPIKESHITVIKEPPLITPVLEMVKAEGNVNTNGRLLNNDDNGTPFNPFMDNITQTSINDEVWIGYGGPSSAGYYDANGNFIAGGLPCVGCSACPPPWTPGCTIDFSIVPFYEAGDIVIFTIPGSSPLKQIRAEILLGPDWNYGSYKVKILTKTGDLLAQDINWTSEIELLQGGMFEFKFPRFATRYKYEDGEYSTYSPWTQVAFLPGKTPMDYLPKKGYNLNMTNNLRKLAIKGFIPHNELLPDDVAEIEIVYKESDSSNIYTVTRIPRNSKHWRTIDNNGNMASFPEWDKARGYVNIKSEMIQGTIAPNQLMRHYDAVPRKAKAQEITGNRLLYGNYLQNYDLSTLNKVNCGPGSNIPCEGQASIDTDIYFSITSKNVGGLQPEEENVEDAGSYGPSKSIKSLRTYQLGVVYKDRYGRETPVFSNIKMSKSLEKKRADNANHLAASVKNVIPDFAESFKFFIKETSNEYYNLPMDRWYDAEDGNVWLSFPSSERSKISINTDEERFEDTFIILKKEHDSNNHVSDRDARYKVLAIENDAPDFIKTIKDSHGILEDQGTGIWALINNQVAVDGFPTVNNDFVRINQTDFESMGWHDTLTGPNMGDLKMRIGTNTLKSSWYNIISTTFVTGSTPQQYEIKVSDQFAGDMAFTAGTNLQVEIIEEKVKYLPEFDGRFFVKIYRDPTLEDVLLTIGVPTVTQYQISSSMLCQVIAPNSDWSDPSNPNGFFDTSAVSPDAWDGWGTSNTNVTSTWEPTRNYQDGVISPNQGATAGTLVSSPITGRDWAISNNHSGQGEQFWSGFEGQDATLGNPGALASRWFIDARVGTNQMFQNMRRTTNNMIDFSGSDWMPYTHWEIDNGGNILGTPSNSVKQTDFNAVAVSIPNNPTVGQSTRQSGLDMGCPTGIALGSGGQAPCSPWTLTEPGATFNRDARFKSPSEGVYSDPATGDTTIIDISCMGFGGPEINSLSFNATWNQGTWLPYDNMDDATPAGLWNVNINSPWLIDNSVLYANDVSFISQLTTPGTLWRWGEDPDGMIYETQNSNTQISDWINSGGTLGGWKRVGESSVHFNTQTIGIDGRSFDVQNSPVISLNPNNPYTIANTIVQTKANSNFPTGGGSTSTGGFSQISDVHSYSSSNTANWNRSQRWTIEARTQSGDELGSGSSGYLPTNDPRWSTSNNNHGNTNNFAPGVRHDGMGWGQTVSGGAGVNTSSVTNGVVNSPADYNASTGVTSGSFTWQILTPMSNSGTYNSTGTFSSGNPAIWETEPRNTIDLDIYYEIGQTYAANLNERTNLLHAPIGSEVRIYRPADSNYVINNPGTPTGWISWPNGNKAFIESWNDFSGTALGPLDPTFPNEIKITDVNGNVMGGVMPFESPFPGDILVFYRADGSTTEAMVYEHFIPNQSPQFIQNKLGGYFTLDESIGNRYIRLPWFNCYSFGNGVESNRIRDDFNEVIIDKGVKASTTIPETYKEDRKSNSLIFSGIYNSKTGINNLNQFIESEGITKDLNPTYGSIQKLYSRDTDIIALCEEKCLRILANKDALFNADGNINMIATPNVLGQAVAYAGDYGISKNPESFAAASFRMYFADKSKGVVLRLSQDGLTPISNVGMSDWFTDNLKNAYEIIGSFDERKGDYNLTVYDHNLDITVDKNILKLGSNTLSYNERVKGWSSFKSFAQEQGYSLNNDYFTAKHGNIWKHHEDSVFRNNFYKEQFDSSITLLFNESPGSVKSFNTLNYEGSQAKITRDITSNPDSIYVPDYYDNFAYDGWYVSEIITNLQETDYLEFKSKEGKWFSQIKGVSTDINNIDPREFSYQGIDEAMTDPYIEPCKWGCTDIPAYNYDPTATCDDGSCLYCVYGCMNVSACNYNPNATCDDGSCLTDYGCTDPVATNYDPNANCDDGSCIYPAPCSDPSPVLKNAFGKIETSCGVYTQSQLTFYVDTNGGLNDVNYDWNIMDSSGNTIGSGTGQLPGQTNDVTIQPIIPAPLPLPNSTTYYISVTDDNGCSSTGIIATISSEYLQYGCTQPSAGNYNPSAICDDGTCIGGTIYGCMDSNANNYAGTGNSNGINPPATIACNDTSPFGCLPPNCLGPGNNECCDYTLPVYGCTDPNAINYDPLATADCDSNNQGCVTTSNPLLANNLLNLTTCTGPGNNECCSYNGNQPLSGCMDPTAVNYNPNAVIQSLCNGSIWNTITNGALDCTDTNSNNYILYPSTPFTSGSNWFPGYACIQSNPGCTDDGGQGNGYRPARTQTWWNNNYATSTGVATWPAANGYGPANNYDENATSEDGSCAYNWMCASAGNPVTGHSSGGIVNPAGQPNGWFAQAGQWIEYPFNPGAGYANNNTAQYWKGSTAATDAIQITGGMGQEHLAGEGAVDTPNNHDNVALNFFFGDQGVHPSPNSPCYGNGIPGGYIDFGCGMQTATFEYYKFLDVNGGQALSTPVGPTPGWCPDIVGPTTTNPLTPQPAYWKRLKRIRLEKNGAATFQMQGNHTWGNQAGQSCPSVTCTWHDNVTDFIQELNIGCNISGQGGNSISWLFPQIVHGMTYEQLVDVVGGDNYYINVEFEWAECQNWNGGQCTIDPNGGHATKQDCEGGASCCPGDPTKPQCN